MANFFGDLNEHAKKIQDCETPFLAEQMTTLRNQVKGVITAATDTYIEIPMSRRFYVKVKDLVAGELIKSGAINVKYTTNCDGDEYLSFNLTPEKKEVSSHLEAHLLNNPQEQ